MDQTPLTITLFFGLMNLWALLLMYADKRRARNSKEGKERISEGLLFFLATLFGSVGVYVGMLLFRHKTKKWYFMLGIPLLILENMAFLYVLFLWLPAV